MARQSSLQLALHHLHALQALCILACRAFNFSR